MVKNLEDNHDMWVKIIETETCQLEITSSATELATTGNVRFIKLLLRLFSGDD